MKLASLKKPWAIAALSAVVLAAGALGYWAYRSSASKRPAKEQASAHPAVFNEATAMLAIFGQYDAKKKATLLPVQRTVKWQIDKAEAIATPMLAAIYEEAGKRKGVLVIQRQALENGEVNQSHLDAPDISVYVFAHNGKDWVFEKGTKQAATAGAFGHAPDCELVKLGADKFGLLFAGGDVHQGYTNDYAFVLALSEPTISEVLNLPTGESNSGACSHDEKDKSDADAPAEACWEHRVTLAFVRTDAPYYTVKARDQGTAGGDQDGAVNPLDATSYYVNEGGKYSPASNDAKNAGTSVMPRDVLVAGAVYQRHADGPTAARQLIK